MEKFNIIILWLAGTSSNQIYFLHVDRQSTENTIMYIFSL